MTLFYIQERKEKKKKQQKNTWRSIWNATDLLKAKARLV
jgi:hypothetical protein